MLYFRANISLSGFSLKIYFVSLFRFLLFPLTLLYDFVTRIRNYFYDIGFFKSKSFDIPVIAVGNLSVGGTGKTPQIEYLIKLLQNDTKVAVLSRGYKRKTTGFVLINDAHTSQDVGDEPLQFFKKFPKICVAVDENRVNGIQELQKKYPLDLVLLDDAFQHRKVKANCYILLTKFDDLYSDDFVLPTGNLRESSGGAKRAHIIIVTKCPIDLSIAKKQDIKKKLKVTSKQHVFFSTISYHNKTSGNQNIPLMTLSDYEIVLLTGIANPTPLVSFLKAKDNKVHHLKYSDHHQFTAKEIDVITAKYSSITSDKKILLTTEKDYMRLSDKISSLSYLKMSTNFEENDYFDTLIRSFLKKHQF